MDKYEVLLYPKALRDLDDIYAYIAREKLAPLNAKRLTDRIWKAIKSLEIFPEAHQERLVGRYAGSGYRQLPVSRFIIIFKIDQPSKKVYVITVQYHGRKF